MSDTTTTPTAKNDDTALLVMMEDEGIDEDLLNACRAYMYIMSEPDLSNFEESYIGSYDTPEEFAQEQADTIGAMNNNGQWPFYCIDWEYAARELMHDHSEHEKHYFRQI